MLKWKNQCLTERAKHREGSVGKVKGEKKTKNSEPKSA